MEVNSYLHNVRLENSFHPPTPHPTPALVCSVSLNPSKNNVQLSPVCFLPIHSSSALDYFLPPLHPTLTVPAQLCACFVLLPCLYMIQSSCILQSSYFPPPSPLVASHLTGCFPTFSSLLLTLSPLLCRILPPPPSLLFSCFSLSLSLSPYLQSPSSVQDVVEHFLRVPSSVFHLPLYVVSSFWSAHRML